MIDWLVPRASTYASDIDGLILLVGVIVGVGFAVAQGVFFYFIVRFRHRDGVKATYLSGEAKGDKRWVNIAHAVVLVADVVIVVAAIMVWVDVKQTLPAPARTVRVIAQQWAWTFVHPGPDGRIDTDDDVVTTDELHVTVGDVHHFRLESRDVVHSFSVPVFRLKQDAIPGREITGWFEPTRTGTFDIQCAEICGIGHGLMGARIVIETPDEHLAWLERRSSTLAAAR
jgi:cytochrome c oxidase subunit II